MHQVTDTGAFIHVEFHGGNLNEVLDAIAEEMSLPAFHRRNDLWHIGPEVLEIHFGQLEEITEFILARYPVGATRTRTALVVAPGLNAGFAEIWAGSAGRLPYEVKVFHDLRAAEAWVCDVPLA